MKKSDPLVRWLLPILVLAVFVCLWLCVPSNHRLGDALFRSLDFTGGVRLEYRMDPADAVRRGIDTDERRHEAIAQAERVFLFRLRNFDLTENAVQTLGDDSIIVEVTETKGVQEAINRTGVVTFRSVEGERAGGSPLLGPPEITAEDIDYTRTTAETEPVSNSSATPENYVHLYMQPKSVEKFKAFTSKYYKREVAICIDDTVHTRAIVSDANIEDPIITGGEGSGKFTRAEVDELANILSAGYLPVSFQFKGPPDETGPRLGAETRSAATWILIGAMCLTLVLMLLRYIDHLAMVIICVVSYGVGLFALLCLVLTHFLTLNAGTVCAFVTLAAMSVDNMILVFEQFRHQTAGKGQGAENATGFIVEAYDSEKWIILSANFTMILALGSLYFVPGPVRNLALAMCFGVVVTWIATVYYPKCWYGWKHFVLYMEDKSPTNKTKFPWVDSKSGGVFRTSVQHGLLFVYIVALVASAILLWQRPLKPGLDLRGGSEMVLVADEGMALDELRSTSEAYFGARSEVYRLDSPEGHLGEFRYVVRISSGTPDQIIPGPGSRRGTSPLPPSAIPAGFVEQWKVKVPTVRLESVRTIGGRELALDQSMAIISVVAGFVLVLVFVGVFFGRAAAVSSTLALIFDGVIGFGCVSLAGIPLTLPIIASILTMIGFSINDSIILCGHIKKDKKDILKVRTSGNDEERAIEMHKNLEKALQPLSARILFTTITTGLAALMLVLFGHGVMRDFGVVLTVGVVFGLMSSVTVVVMGVEHSLRKELPKAQGATDDI